LNDSRRSTHPHVTIAILNWNGWRDTTECLESVFRLDYPSFTVIVCDNASTDGSLDKIEDWANGRVPASCGNAGLERLVSPPIPKPIRSAVISDSAQPPAKQASDVPLLLIQTGSNLGFAGGNNVCIRFALTYSQCEYVWLLNNDTVVEPDALSTMVRTAESDPKLGICGSVLRTYAPPHSVQTVGRTYTRFSGRTHLIEELAAARVSGTAEYVVEGASMLVRRAFLEDVGLLEEGYFLYFEELDWTARGRPAFHFGYCPTSVVYHKMGGSIGSSLKRSTRSLLSDFYQARNRLAFTKRHHPGFFVSVLAAVSLSAMHRFVIGRPQNASAILQGALASFSRTRSRGQAFP
jgi:GT2 family glycosyltransferase